MQQPTQTDKWENKEQMTVVVKQGNEVNWSLKAMLNKWVFRVYLKVLREGARQLSNWREFQRVGAATLKARYPKFGHKSLEWRGCTNMLSETAKTWPSTLTVVDTTTCNRSEGETCDLIWGNRENDPTLYTLVKTTVLRVLVLLCPLFPVLLPEIFGTI